MAGTLFVVATPIGNLEDITLRALRVLREVGLIAAEDTRRTAHLLARHGITTRTTSLHEHNERGKSRVVIDRLLAGEHVALVSDAGTPAISDPGGNLVAQALAAGIRVEPIPGPSALTALLSVAGETLTGFSFAGFPPTKAKDRKLWLDRIADSGTPVVFYEAPHRIRRTLSDIQARVGDVAAVVGRELTKSHEELVYGPISTASERFQEPRGEFVVLLLLAKRHNYSAGTAPPETGRLAHEFGELTEKAGLGRRAAISELAKRYRLSSRDVYSAVELHKDSGGTD